MGRARNAARDNLQKCVQIAIDRESYVLALLYSNITFRLTSIKLFHEGDIKINNEPKYNPKLHDPELYNKDEGNIDTIPLTILLKYNRGRPYKYPNITVFL